MNTRQALALALRTIRKARSLSQEDFGVVSSRTYISSLERGLKSPTLDKLEAIADVMKVSPATLVLVAYAIAQESNTSKAIDDIALAAKALLPQLPRDDRSER